MNSIRLLLITSEFPPQPGGIGNHAFHLSNALHQNNFEVTVLADQRSEDGSAERDFDSALPFRVIRTRRQKQIWLSYMQRVLRAYRQAKKTDLVLVSGKFPLWLGGGLSLLSKKKIMAIIHGSELLLRHSLLQKLTDWSLKQCDQIVAVSAYTESLVAHLSLKSVTVIHNGFHIENQKAHKISHNKPSGVLRLITVGNLTERKGQRNVIQLLPALIDKYGKVEYHMVGIPTLDHQFKALAKDLNVASHCFFHGRLSEEQKFRILKEATLFAMLSERTKTGDVEGFGIAILEANALGVPAIGSRNCGIEEAINNGRSGCLVEPHKTGEFLEAVDTILNNYVSFSTNAIIWSQNFTWDKVVPRYIEIIQRLV